MITFWFNVGKSTMKKADRRKLKEAGVKPHRILKALRRYKEGSFMYNWKENILIGKNLEVNRLQVQIRCLSCGRFDEDEAESMMTKGKSLCPHCNEDCLGFVDENGNAVKLDKRLLSEDQIQALLKGNTILIG